MVIRVFSYICMIYGIGWGLCLICFLTWKNAGVFDKAIKNIDSWPMWVWGALACTWPYILLHFGWVEIKLLLLKTLRWLTFKLIGQPQEKGETNGQSDEEKPGCN